MPNAKNQTKKNDLPILMKFWRLWVRLLLENIFRREYPTSEKIHENDFVFSFAMLLKSRFFGRASEPQHRFSGHLPNFNIWPLLCASSKTVFSSKGNTSDAHQQTIHPAAVRAFRRCTFTRRSLARPKTGQNSLPETVPTRIIATSSVKPSRQARLSHCFHQMETIAGHSDTALLPINVLRFDPHGLAKLPTIRQESSRRVHLPDRNNPVTPRPTKAVFRQRGGGPITRASNCRMFSVKVLQSLAAATDITISQSHRIDRKTCQAGTLSHHLVELPASANLASAHHRHCHETTNA